MRHINQVSKPIKTINSVTLVMAWLAMGVYLVASFISGNLLYTSLKFATNSPDLNYLAMFMAICLLIFSYYMFYLSLRQVAEINSTSPYFIVDDNGISWLGLGVTRDIYISWRNIKDFHCYGSSNYICRIWPKEIDNAWASKGSIYRIFASIINFISLGLITKNFELPFYQFRPGILGLTKLEFKDILDKQINHASENLRQSASECENTSNLKSNPRYKLLYFAPLVFMLIGFFKNAIFRFI